MFKIRVIHAYLLWEQVLFDKITHQSHPLFPFQIVSQVLIDNRLWHWFLQFIFLLFCNLYSYCLRWCRYKLSRQFIDNRLWHWFCEKDINVSSNRSFAKNYYYTKTIKAWMSLTIGCKRILTKPIIFRLWSIKLP